MNHERVYPRDSGINAHSPVSLGEIFHHVKGAAPLYRLTARGISMNPFLRDGDLVTIRPCAVVRPRQGDIVAFVHPDSGQLLLHRVIGKTKCAYLTQGDNALQNDGLIAERHVLGAVTEVVRARRRVRRSLGPERLLIVFLIRLRLLSRLLSLLRRFRKTSMLRSESEF